MKRLILCLLVTIAGLHTVVAEPVILPVKTDTAPFFFYYDELPSDSYNLTVHYVANGTKATILGWVENGAKLKVVLEDGSIGYMPTIAFSYEKNMRFTLLKHIDEEEYQLLGIGKWQDENGNPSLVPEYIRCKDVENSVISNLSLVGEYPDVTFEEEGYSPWSVFGDFYKKYPQIDTNLVRNYTPTYGTIYRLRKDEIPVRFVGYSRSYIESLIGPAFAYAGPGLSPFEGYTYAFYHKLVWDIPRSNMNTVGCFVFYDKDMTVAHIEPCFMWENYSADMQRAYVPMKAKAQPDTVIRSLIAQAPVKVARLVVGADSEEQIDSVTPPWYDMLRLKALYSNEFYVFLVLLIVFLLQWWRLKKTSLDSTADLVVSCLNGLLMCLWVWQVLRVDVFYDAFQEAIRWSIWILGDAKILLFLMAIVVSVAYVALWRWVLLPTIFRAGSSSFFLILSICLTITFVKSVCLALWGNGLLLIVAGGVVAFLACLIIMNMISTRRCSRCGHLTTAVRQYSATCTKCGNKWEVLHFSEALEHQLRSR